MITLSDILALGFSDKQLMRHMPPRIAEIASVIGVRKAIMFSLKYGGGEFYIPDRIEEKNSPDIVELIGYEDAKKLCLFLSELYIFRIEVPSCFSGVAFRRLRGIKLLMEGKSYRAVAKEIGISRSTAKVWYENFVRTNATDSRPSTDQSKIKADLNAVERVAALSPSLLRASAPKTASGAK